MARTTGRTPRSLIVNRIALIGSSWGGWLYDVVWLRTDSDPLWEARWTLRKVELVAELEWYGRDNAWEDYQKTRKLRFPMLGETVTLEWQQNQQTFVITDLE